MSDYKPVVGDRCEMMGNNVWVHVEVIAWISGFYVGWNHKDKTVYYSDKLTDFRPIRTQEEVEREEAVEDIAHSLALHDSFSKRKQAEEIILLGYQKVGEKVSSKEFIASFELNKIPLYMFVDNYEICRKVKK